MLDFLIDNIYVKVRGKTNRQELMNEWMNECLTTPQCKNKIGYWVLNGIEKLKSNMQILKIYKVINTV